MRDWEKNKRKSMEMKEKEGVNFNSLWGKNHHQ